MTDFGKVIVNGEEIHACCTRPNFIAAWIKALFKWRALYCKNCGNVTGPVGRMAWLYELGFHFFWKGMVEIDESQLSSDEKERLQREQEELKTMGYY